MDKKKYIEGFEKSLDGFVDELQEYVSTETGEWTIKELEDGYLMLLVNWRIQLNFCCQ